MAVVRRQFGDGLSREFSIMQTAAEKLRADVERIWRAGVAAVLPERLVPEHVQVDGNWLVIDDDSLDLSSVQRIAIVGAGKAAGAMAVAFEKVLGPQLLAGKNVVGWINVPADCVEPTQHVHLHAARPAGVNEPRPEGVKGTQEIRKIVSSLTKSDICVCVLSGGGSALLPAPIDRLPLDEKIRLTRLMSAAGANIEQLNIVRQQLSLVKGGNLALDCTAGWLITLAISDVLGDPPDIIASGPTVLTSRAAADALAVLDELNLAADLAIKSLVRYLKNHGHTKIWQRVGEGIGPPAHMSFHILGNNATAVDAAGVEAERLGYSHAMIAATKPEGSAEEVGRHLASMALRMRDEPGTNCLISGGEPTVTLVDEEVRGEGGRNQQLALAALTKLGDCRGIAMLAAGTDGEDGPTDAAGAFVSEEVVRAAAANRIAPSEFLTRNDAYHFFETAGGLFVTGPTRTNVCDLRVVAVDQINQPSKTKA
jgi:glycerate 2-kinase